MDSLIQSISRIHHCGNLWRTAQMRQQGITGIQQTYLFYICRHPGISQEMLARQIMVNKSNVTRRLDQLECEGYIIRKIQPDDKRNHAIYPTDKALSVFPKIQQLIQQWNQLLTEELTVQEKEVVLSCLQKMAIKAQSLCQEGESSV